MSSIILVPLMEWRGAHDGTIAPSMDIRIKLRLVGGERTFAEMEFSVCDNGSDLEVNSHTWLEGSDHSCTDEFTSDYRSADLGWFISRALVRATLHFAALGDMVLTASDVETDVNDLSAADIACPVIDDVRLGGTEGLDDDVVDGIWRSVHSLASYMARQTNRCRRILSSNKTRTTQQNG